METKLCPLMMIAHKGEDVRCIKDDCAWYINRKAEIGARCAIKETAEALVDIYTDMPTQY